MSGCDLLVLGGGTAGLSAARAARRRGASVVLVTDGPPGGDCTFTGCVPSKTLLAATRLPFSEAMARVHATVAAVAHEESAEVLRSEGITVLDGRGTVLSRHQVEVNGEVVTARRLVLATGSAPLVPELPGLSDIAYLTNETLFDLTELPEHLVVLGGGAIGCEMAQAFARLGSQVTVLEGAERVLGKEEPEASAEIDTALRADGVEIRTATKVEAVAKVRGGVSLSTANGSVRGTHLLVAVGRRPSSQGLTALGLSTGPSGAIEVDARMRTSLRHVYAAGDVTGRMPFTHAADEMGRVAATTALGRIPLRFAERAVPWVTFTDPEVARVGLTEALAAQRVRGARVVEVPMSEVDRARTSQRTDGFVKVIVGPRLVTRNAGGGQVLGATIVAERAGEMIAELTLAMRARVLAGRLAQTSHAYPTWSVAVQQAVAQLFGGYGGRTPRPARTSS